jgi:hypothetical protein
MQCLIVESEDGKRWTAYAETGARLCSDTNYQDCLIKVGLLGYKMNPVSPNSWAAERIREKVQFYGGPKNG